MKKLLKALFLNGCVAMIICPPSKAVAQGLALNRCASEMMMAIPGSYPENHIDFGFLRDAGIYSPAGEVSTPAITTESLRSMSVQSIMQSMEAFRRRMVSLGFSAFVLNQDEHLKLKSLFLEETLNRFGVEPVGSRASFGPGLISSEVAPDSQWSNEETASSLQLVSTTATIPEPTPVTFLITATLVVILGRIAFLKPKTHPFPTRHKGRTRLSLI